MCDAMHKVGATCELITDRRRRPRHERLERPEMQHWKPEMIAWLKKTMQ